jgi:hypothetical protein
MKHTESRYFEKYISPEAPDSMLTRPQNLCLRNMCLRRFVIWIQVAENPDSGERLRRVVLWVNFSRPLARNISILNLACYFWTNLDDVQRICSQCLWFRCFASSYDRVPHTRKISL